MGNGVSAPFSAGEPLCDFLNPVVEMADGGDLFKLERSDQIIFSGYIIMSKKTSAKKSAFKYARSREDKAQNVLLNNLDKRVKNMEQSIEKKYSYVQLYQDAIEPWDPTTAIGRQVNMKQIRIGTIQGTQDFNQRVGDTVSVKSIDFRYNVGVEGSASGNPAQANNRIRVMMFWDTQPVEITNAGGYTVNTPEWQLLLQGLTVTIPAPGGEAILSPKDHDTGKRFQVIHDEVHTLCPLEGTNGGSRSGTNKTTMYKSYKVGKKLRYQGGGAQPINRSLYLCYFADTEAGLPLPYVSHSVKVIYEDA